jgi:predicted O-methyltransferase YrrM
MADTRYNPRIDYIQSLYAPEDELLKEISESLDTKSFNMQLSPVEARLIQLLLKLSGAHTVLEIGTLVGYSSIWIARSLPEQGRLVSIEKSEEHYRKTKANILKAGLQNKVEILHGDAANLLPNLRGYGLFDAVFIDANKTGYPLYLDLVYDLLCPGGLIIADNTLLFDSVIHSQPPKTSQSMWRAMRKFNEMLADTTRFEAILIPNEEGLSVAIKR